MGTSRKKKQAKAIDYDPQDPNSWPEDMPKPIEIDPEDQEIDDAFSTLPQHDACIELFRTSKVGGRPVFLEQMTPAMFKLSYVAEKFGGGVYYARAKYKDGTPIKMPFEIEGDPFPVKRVVPNPAMAPIQQPSSQAPQNPEPYVIEGGDPHLSQVLTLILRRLERSETDVLEKMKMYKELFGSSKQEAPLDVALNMFQKGLEMASMTGESGGSPWMLMLREFREPLMKIVDTVQVAMTRAVPPGGGAPVPPTPPASPGPGANQGLGKDAQVPPGGRPRSAGGMGERFAPIIPILVTAASRNADPASYSSVVLDLIPSQAYGAVYEWLRSPGCLDELVTVEPGIQYQREWWDALRASLLTDLAEELSHGDGTVQSPPASEPSAEPATPRDSVPGTRGGGGGADRHRSRHEDDGGAAHDL